MAGTGGTRLESGRSVRVSARIQEEWCEAGGRLDRVVVGELGGGKAGVPRVLQVMAIAS